MCLDLLCDHCVDEPSHCSNNIAFLQLPMATYIPSVEVLLCKLMSNEINCKQYLTQSNL